MTIRRLEYSQLQHKLVLTVRHKGTSPQHPYSLSYIGAKQIPSLFYIIIHPKRSVILRCFRSEHVASYGLRCLQAGKLYRQLVPQLLPHPFP
jgi:hypothetical protein